MNKVSFKATKSAYRNAIRLDTLAFKKQKISAQYCDVPGRGPSSVRPTSHYRDMALAGLTSTEIIAIQSRPYSNTGRLLCTSPRVEAIHSPRKGVSYGYLPLYKRVVIRQAIQKLEEYDAARRL